MPTLNSFDYAVVRVVPRVEREEFLNAGVIVFSRPLAYLGARVGLDHHRLRVIDPSVDADEVQRYLTLIPLICSGDSRGGEPAGWPISARFHWLVAPRSTIIQTSAVHSGLSADPAVELDRLFEQMVVLAPDGSTSG